MKKNKQCLKESALQAWKSSNDSDLLKRRGIQANIKSYLPKEYLFLYFCLPTNWETMIYHLMFVF